MKPMSYEELQQFAEDNWQRVEPEKRKLCVEHLRSLFSPEDFEFFKKAFEIGEFGSWFHFAEGMAIRNALRDVIKDDELPGVKYSGGDTYEFKNWDDFYMAALRQAV